MFYFQLFSNQEVSFTRGTWSKWQRKIVIQFTTNTTKQGLIDMRSNLTTTIAVPHKTFHNMIVKKWEKENAGFICIQQCALDHFGHGSLTV